MQAAGPDTRQLSDEQLATRVGAGDRDAFAALYERHFQDIHDFAARVLRDRELAADVVQATFTKLWVALQKPKGVVSVKAWLYRVAHNGAIDELRDRKRQVPVGDDEAFAVVDESRFADADAVLRDRELVELVWSSAAALNPQEYALLDLHLRKGLDADALAETLQLRKGAVYTRLSRLKDSLEDAVTSTLLVRRGRDDCEELDALVVALGAAPPPEVRAAVNRHLDACELCQASRRRYVTAAEIFAGLAPLPVDPSLYADVWSRIEGALGSGAPPRRRVSRREVALGAAVAIAALAVAAGVVLAARGGEARPVDPFDVHSVDHRVGIASTDRVIALRWTRVLGAGGYSVMWSKGAAALPDRSVDLAGTALGAESAPLSPGRWYFNLRTRAGSAASWTSTVHVGPFVLVGELCPPAPEIQAPDKQQAPAHQGPKAERSDRTRAKQQPDKPAPAETEAQPAAPPVATFAVTVRRSGSGSGTVTSSPAGIACGATCTHRYRKGARLTLSAEPEATSELAGWGGACSGTGACVVTVERATSVTASFSRKRFALTVAKAGAGVGAVQSTPAGVDCGSTCTATFTAGTTVTLTAEPDSQSEFTGWSGACTGSAACTVAIQRATTVTATFAKRSFGLTADTAGGGGGAVRSDPAGIECPSACSAAYPAGTRVTLVADPDLQSDFAEWGGACSGSGACTVTMDAAKSVTATFTRKQFTLTVGIGGAGHGSVKSQPGGIGCPGDCSEGYGAGTVVTLVPSPGPGSAFAGWSGDCIGPDVCQVTMNGARSVTATFRPLP